MKRMLISAVACAVVLASCGGGDGAEGPVDVATKYTRAGERGDGKTQCGLLAEAPLAAYGGREKCEAERAHEPIPEAALEYRDVNDDGDRATLTEIAGKEGEPRTSRTIELIRESGEWKVGRVGTLRAQPET